MAFLAFYILIEINYFNTECSNGVRKTPTCEKQFLPTTIDVKTKIVIATICKKQHHSVLF